MAARGVLKIKAMTTQQALDILKRHNIWRRGADIQMQSPAEIGEAIDKAVEVLQEAAKQEQETQK
jgi:hypothetical protein